MIVSIVRVLFVSFFRFSSFSRPMHRLNLHIFTPVFLHVLRCSAFFALCRHDIILGFFFHHIEDVYVCVRVRERERVFIHFHKSLLNGLLHCNVTAMSGLSWITICAHHLRTDWYSALPRLGGLFFTAASSLRVFVSANSIFSHFFFTIFCVSSHTRLFICCCRKRCWNRFIVSHLAHGSHLVGAISYDECEVVKMIFGADWPQTF